MAESSIFAYMRFLQNSLSPSPVWNGGQWHPPPLPFSPNPDCLCLGKICIVDIICYFCREENLSSSAAAALKALVSILLSKVESLVRRVEPSISLLEAIDLILEGAQNLVCADH